MFRKLTAVVAGSLLPALLAAQQMPATPPSTTSDTAFHPISLAQALKLAHDNNVQNITADNAVRSAGNALRGTKAQLIPTLTATTNQSLSAGQRLGQSGDLVPITSSWTYTTGLTSQMTLFDAGKMFADIKTQQANVSAAQASEINTDYSVALNVKEAYNTVLASKESESAAEAQLATAQLQLATSIAKVNAGAANISDSLRSVVAVGNAQLALLTAQTASRTAAAALTRLVGTTYFVTADIADTLEQRPGTPIDSASLMQLALNGPTIRAAQASVAAASASERSAKTAYLPVLTGNVNFGGSGAGSWYGLNSNPYPYSRGVSVGLSYPLFNRFTRENNIANAQIAYDNAEATERDSKLAAQQNILTDIAALRVAEESMRIQALNVQADEEDLRVVQQRYALGASVLLDVLTSQQNLVSGRQALIQARLNLRNARAQIESVIGKDLP